MTEPFEPSGGCGDCLLFGAIQSMDDGLVLVDPGGKIFLINRCAERLLGVEATRVLGIHLLTCLRDPGLIAFWESAAAESGLVTTELDLPSGVNIRATFSGCISASGERIGTALQLRDVTREKRMRVELSMSVAKRLVEMAGGDGTGPETPALTRREGEILHLLAAGLSNAEIAARLHVTVNTVASHLKHLYTKIGVNSRTQAAAYALSRGIRPPPDLKAGAPPNIPLHRREPLGGSEVSPSRRHRRH